MKVELLSVTPDALNLLLRTKNTRLKFDSDPATWPEEKREEHLAYMRDTIKSSWEFCDYVFRISGVTRAFTHQLVRTRHGSYAQESQRTVDVRGSDVIPPFGALTVEQQHGWDRAASTALHAYGILVDSKLPVQDARGILPTNMSTSIVAKFNLRTLHDMSKLRLCTRAQGEYQSVFRAMRELVVGAHPWASDFLQVHCVSEGTCAFPRYGKTSCKFYDPRMDLTELKRDTALKFWSATELNEAVPVAVGGKTM